MVDLKPPYKDISVFENQVDKTFLVVLKKVQSCNKHYVWHNDALYITIFAR